MVMGVGLDPELTKWSVRSGLVNFLTGRGYKEHHWLVVPHQPLRLSSHQQYLLCLLLLIIVPPPLALFPVPSTNWESVGLPFRSILKLGTTPLKTALLPRSCITRRSTK